MATHSSILAWRNAMDRGAWQDTVHGVARIGHDLATVCMYVCMYVRGHLRALPFGWRSRKMGLPEELVGCSLLCLRGRMATDPWQESGGESTISTQKIMGGHALLQDSHAQEGGAV